MASKPPKPPDAFLSYTRADDRRERGRISQFRQELEEEMRAVTGEAFEIFQDVDDIDVGERWSEKLDQMLDEARFFIPIVTPSYFKSKACRDELAKFLKAEKAKGRAVLVLPIYYIECDVLEDADLRTTDPLAMEIHERQHHDWRKLRHSSFSTKAVKIALHDLARAIGNARRSPIPPRLTRQAGAEFRALSERARSKPALNAKPPEQLAKIERPRHPSRRTVLATVLGSVGIAGGGTLVWQLTSRRQPDTDLPSQAAAPAPAVSHTSPQTAALSSSDLPFFGQYYGGGWPSIADVNYRLSGKPCQFLFYAELSGTVTGIQWSWRQQAPEPSNYSEGDGGIYTIQIVEADATTKRERPGGQVICSVDGIAPGNPVGSDSTFPEYDFTTTGELGAGQPYVIKVINTHPDPNSNHVSQNVVRYYVWNSSNPPHFTEPGGGGAIGDILVASRGIRGNVVGSSIARVRGYAPHMIDQGGDPFLLYPVPIGSEGSEFDYRRLGGIDSALRYSDGVYTGWGRGSGTPSEYQFKVTGSNQLRQRFRVTRASRTVSGVFVMGWVNGTSGDLQVRLESGPETDDHTPGNGSLIEQVNVPASMFLDAGPTLEHNQLLTGSDTGALDLVHYVWVPFITNRTLTLNHTYNLRLVPSGCDFRMIGGARGDDKYGIYGRKASTWATWAINRKISWTCFEDSRGPQVSTDGGSTWAYGPAEAQQVPITFKCV